MYFPAPDTAMEQPGEIVREAVQTLLTRTKTSIIFKMARYPETVLFKMEMPHPLRSKDNSVWYEAMGLAYSADGSEPKGFRYIELAVGILEPIDEHWFYWYAQTP